MGEAGVEHPGSATPPGRDQRTQSMTRRRQLARWGVVACPDGPHRIDLLVMRKAMTRMLVGGELNDQLMADVARKVGLSRSTVSRLFGGRLSSLPTLLKLLALLGLTFDQVVEQTDMSSEGPGHEDRHG
jgi:transcriptional regulator with XRE-family HTH domain